MPNMKSEWIEDEKGICNVAHYVHSNPVHHGFVKNLSSWRFSSYNAYLSQSATRVSKDIILNIFGSLENFYLFVTSNQFN